MSDLKMLQSEIDDLNQQAQAAEAEATHSRVLAESHRAGGDTTRAQYETSMALKKQKESGDFSTKAQQLEKQAMSMRQEAQLVQKQITDLQDKLANMTGESRPHIL